MARRSRRTAASLTWEIRLLEHLRRSGVRVPAVVPTPDGRRYVRFSFSKKLETLEAAVERLAGLRAAV